MNFVDLVQVASAVGTLVAAVIGWAAAVAARSAARAGNVQAEAAQRQVRLAVEAASNAARMAEDASRARADQTAPRMLIALNNPDSELLLFEGRSEGSLLSPEALARSRSFARANRIPPDNLTVWFKGRGYVVNEGDSSALVWSGDDIVFSPSDDFQSDFMGLPVVSAKPLRAGEDNWFLAPGRSALRFQWAAGRNLTSWLHDVVPDPDRVGLSVKIKARSVGDSTVVDTFETELIGCPITKDSLTGEWVAIADWREGLRLVTNAPRRAYRIE